MQVMFLICWQYQPNITGIELCVEFEEVAATKANYEDVPYSYAMSQHHDVAVHSSNLMSEPCYILLIFLFSNPCLLASI